MWMEGMAGVVQGATDMVAGGVQGAADMVAGVVQGVREFWEREDLVTLRKDR